MKGVKSSVYKAAAMGISRVSSAGSILSFRARAPSGLVLSQVEIYY